MGAAIAGRLPAEGARLVLTDISERRLMATAQTLGDEFPGSIRLAQRASVIVADEIAALASALSGEPIDVLVNTVGGIRDKDVYKPIRHITEQRWDETFCIWPGLIETTLLERLSDTEADDLIARTPLKRAGQPEDIAAPSRFSAAMTPQTHRRDPSGVRRGMAGALKLRSLSRGGLGPPQLRNDHS